MIAYLTLENVWQGNETVEGWQMEALLSEMLVDFWNSEGCMIGAVIDSWREVQPAHWLICDGTEYLRVDYPKLYEVLDSNLIVDGNRFVTPDLRGRTTIGENLTSNYQPLFELYEVNEHGGKELHHLTDNEMPNHGHSPIVHHHGYVEQLISVPIFQGELPVPINVVISGENFGTMGADANVEPSGQDEPHNNMQPFRVAKKVIVAR